MTYTWRSIALQKVTKETLCQKYSIAHVVENHFSNPQASSFAHFVTVSDGLSAEQAAKVPGERFNSVWGVVNHIAFWQEVTCLALRGQQINLADLNLSEMGSGSGPTRRTQ